MSHKPVGVGASFSFTAGTATLDLTKASNRVAGVTKKFYK